ncbi:MAG: UDP-N-acetylmuramoyl-L-alanine--D-glutamate ligase [Eubacteriales bacterium]|nr:UDP-N-acetylmuramoyl-L-alanine--D-glutamate ligase [Eubacteriales bacterium]
MEGKRVLVMGMARSGIAAAELLAKAGCTALINDRKSEAELGEGMAALHRPGVEWHLGEDPVQLVSQADALVLSPGIPDTHPAVAAARAQGKEVLAEIELAWRMFRGTTAAITGTNGKTTTTTLLTEIFKNAGKKADAVGNIGVPFTGVCFDSAVDDVAVCEVSSFQMETCSRFHPKAAAVLNITPDHLNRHGTMEVYIGLKKKLFANMTDGDTLVLNRHDEAVRAMAGEARCRVAFFSRKDDIEYGAFVRGGMILFGARDDAQEICPAQEVCIQGEHNLENALAATALAMSMGVKAEVVAHTLRTFRGVEHRIEQVQTIRGVTFINDSKGTNADSTVVAVRTMKRPTVLIAGGSEKNQDFSELCREILRSQIREVVLIGQTAGQMQKQLAEHGFARVHMAGSDFAAAVRMAQGLAGEGWNVLLSPANASFDMFTDYEERGRVFKEIVARLAEE